MDASTVYTICFGAGVLVTLISALAANVFGGDADVGATDVAGFAPLSPSTIAAFVAAFGGIGMILSRIEATSSPWVSAPLATIGGVGASVVAYWLLNTIFKRTQSSSEGHVAELIGHSATVITPIPTGGVGEIAYVQSGSRYSGPARSASGAAVAAGAEVKIDRIVGGQFYVKLP